MSANYLRLEITSNLNNKELACDAVVRFAEQFGFAVEQLQEIRVCVEEVINNCMSHAYSGRAGVIRVLCRVLNNNVLGIIIKDIGAGITDVEKAREAFYTTCKEGHAGMGFTIIETFMDSLEISSIPGKGTTVNMKKKLRKTAGHQSL